MPLIAISSLFCCFIASDLPSWRHLFLIVWICCFPRNLFAFSLPVVLICLIRLASFHPFVLIAICCLRFENRVLHRLFAVRIRCWIYWILDALVEINYKTRIISWCEERNPMWWLSSIPASCVEIGCMVGQCLFHLGTNPMWRGSPTMWMIAQSLPLPIRCHLVMCLLYRRYFVQFSSDFPIIKCCWFAFGKSDAVGLNSLVRFPNRMLFAFGFLMADFNLHNRSIHVCKLDLCL